MVVFCAIMLFVLFSYIGAKFFIKFNYVDPKKLEDDYLNYYIAPSDVKITCYLILSVVFFILAAIAMITAFCSAMA